MKSHVYQAHRLSRLKKELHEIYANQIIIKFASALIGVFIPLYILNLGFDLTTALMFMMVFWCFHGIPAPIIAKLASKIGLKHSIVVSIPVLILFYFLLLFTIPSTTKVVLYLIAAIYGLGACLYWIPLNSEFVRNSDKIHRGVEVSHLLAFPHIGAVVAPVIGGIVLNFLGFNPLFIMVVVIMILSIIPLFLTKDYMGSFHFKLREFRLAFKKRLAIGHFLRGSFNTTGELIWPIFVFLTLKDFALVGIASALSGVGVSIFILVVGKLTDKFNRRNIMKIGGLVYACVWFARIFSGGMVDIFILSFLSGVTITLIEVPLFARFCDYSKRNNILGTVSTREWWLTFGRIVPLIVIIVLAANFSHIFLGAGILSLLFIFL